MNITLKVSGGHIDLHTRVSMMFSSKHQKIRIMFNGDTPNLTFDKDSPSFEDLLFWLVFWDGKAEGQIIDVKQWKRENFHKMSDESIQNFMNLACTDEAVSPSAEA